MKEFNKKIVPISKIIETKEFLDGINSYDVKDILFLDENGSPVEIDQQILDDWKFTGLNSFDFIATEFYKTGFTDQEN